MTEVGIVIRDVKKIRYQLVSSANELEKLYEWDAATGCRYAAAQIDLAIRDLENQESIRYD